MSTKLSYLIFSLFLTSSFAQASSFTSHESLEDNVIYVRLSKSLVVPADVRGNKGTYWETYGHKIEDIYVTGRVNAYAQFRNLSLKNTPISVVSLMAAHLSADKYAISQKTNVVIPAGTILKLKVYRYKTFSLSKQIQEWYLNGEYNGRFRSTGRPFRIGLVFEYHYASASRSAQSGILDVLNQRTSQEVNDLSFDIYSSSID